jgi:hypothetical protein
MKGNIKKLAIIVIITVMAPFVMAAVASADGHDWKAIHGEYAMTGGGNCIFSLSGFNPNFTPTGSYWHGSSLATGIWTFKRNGKGTVQQGTQLALTLPPSPIPTSASSAEFSFDFTYKVTDDGTITVDVVPGTFTGEYVTGPLAGVTFTYVTPTFSMLGMVSADHKTITLASGNDVQQINLSNGMSVYSICNLARVLIRLGE